MNNSHRIPIAGEGDVTAVVRDNRVHIRSDVDQRFRRALKEAVAQDGGKTARIYITRALDNGPSRKGAAQTIAFYGNDLAVKLALTSDIVDGLAIALPGFKKWLELTGFANDLTMVKGFIAWAEYRNGRGRVITGAKEAFDA